MNETETVQCAKAVAQFRGLYARVALKLGVDASYISRIARGERKSKVAAKALVKEFNKIVASMRNGSARFSKKPYVVLGLQCPCCKTPQKVQVAVHIGVGNVGGERISCISCDHHFKVTIPEKIIREPFPA
jgi:hypothetical protein